jgi:hypothetical protein
MVTRTRRRIAAAGICCLALLVLAGAASGQEGTLFVEGDQVGIGVASPTALLHLKKSDGTAQVFVEEADPSVALRTLFRMVNTGPVNTQHETPGATWRQQFQDNAYTLTKNGTGGNEMTIIASTGDMTIRGSLFTSGPDCSTGCDDVLEPDFPLESIEEHAEAMLGSGYLPAVGPTLPRAQINVSQKIGGILNELEKAHLYIIQLNERLAEQEAELTRLREGSDQFEDLQARLQRLESLLGSTQLTVVSSR